jgi:hypothetical protein
LIGFAASLTAAVAFAVGVTLVSKEARWLLTAALGRMLNIDVEYVFPTKAEAEADIKREVKRSGHVRLLTGRGNELQRGTFEALLGKRQQNDHTRFEILLPTYGSETGHDYWVDRREGELAVFDPAFGRGTLAADIERNVRYLTGYLNGGDVTVSLYSFPQIGRILLTDRAAFLTPYRSGTHGREDPVIKFRRGGEMYSFLERLYGEIASASSKVVPPQRPTTEMAD